MQLNIRFTFFPLQPELNTSITVNATRVKQLVTEAKAKQQRDISEFLQNVSSKKTLIILRLLMLSLNCQAGFTNKYYAKQKMRHIYVITPSIFHIDITKNSSNNTFNTYTKFYSNLLYRYRDIRQKRGTG